MLQIKFVPRCLVIDMKKLLAGMLLGLSLISTHAVAIDPQWANVVVSAGRWLYLYNAENQERRAYQIRVQGVGATEQQARQQAFALAVEQAVGTLLVSETEIDINDVVRRDLLNYSSGYIYNFKYVSRTQSAQGVRLVIDVWVQESDIAERIATISRDKSKLEGNRISNTLASIEKEQASGDRLLEIVLNDFPTKSYEIETTRIEYTVENRVPYLNVSYNVSWREEYIRSLKDTLRTVGVRSRLADNDPGMLFVDTNCVFCRNEGYATDSTRGHKIQIDTFFKQPHLLVTILNSNRVTVVEQCWWFPNLGGDTADVLLTAGGHQKVNVYPEQTLYNTMKMDISAYDAEDMHSVELNIVSKNNCPELQ